MARVRWAIPWLVLGASLVAFWRIRHAWPAYQPHAEVGFLLFLSAYLLYSLLFRRFERPGAIGVAEIQKRLLEEEEDERGTTNPTA